MPAGSPHSSRVVVVTGASRGVGKGIALALGALGDTVYVTGRSERRGQFTRLPGTIHETAAAIDALGGHGIPIACDHRSDEQVRILFETVAQQAGRLDILVNNVCALPKGLTDPGGFWQKPLELLDILDVGMRSHYVASYYGAPMMVEQKSGLIVHTSSAGGRCYMHGPAYGGGKAAVDKFANDMAVDLRPFHVACVSLWMGLVRTERTSVYLERLPKEVAAATESPQFAGRIIDALYRDPNLMAKSGQILVAAEEAQAYQLKDIDGRQPPSPTPRLGRPAQANPAVVQ